MSILSTNVPQCSLSLAFQIRIHILPHGLVATVLSFFFIMPLDFWDGPDNARCPHVTGFSDKRSVSESKTRNAGLEALCTLEDKTAMLAVELHLQKIPKDRLCLTSAARLHSVQASGPKQNSKLTVADDAVALI